VGAGKLELLDRLQTFVVNPLVRRALQLGIPDPGDALLETTGWSTGQPRLTPVCDCLEGDTFWVFSSADAKQTGCGTLTSIPVSESWSAGVGVLCGAPAQPRSWTETTRANANVR
jgi:hypothetical protein